MDKQDASMSVGGNTYIQPILYHALTTLTLPVTPLPHPHYTHPLGHSHTSLSLLSPSQSLPYHTLTTLTLPVTPLHHPHYSHLSSHPSTSPSLFSGVSLVGSTYTMGGSSMLGRRLSRMRIISEYPSTGSTSGARDVCRR